MKKFIMVLLIAILPTMALKAQVLDHSFSYQGELLDGGNPANGSYDFKVQMVDSMGLDVGTASVHDNIQVTNGLFNLDVTIGGINQFIGDQDYFFEISIRTGSSTGSYTVLNGVQTLQAVPLATNLTSGSATTGQVLTFTGSKWEPAARLWNEGASSNIISTMDAVGIGTSTPQNILHVKINAPTVATFEGSGQMFVSFIEDGIDIGYIGSLVSSGTSTVGPVNKEDLDIGTSFANNIGSVHLSIKGDPVLTATSNKDVSIGTTQASDLSHKLVVKSGSDDNALRLIGSQGSVGAGARLSFGDGPFTFIQEDTDDHLLIYAERGVRMTTAFADIDFNSGGKVTIKEDISGTANMKPYVYGHVNSDGSVLSGKSSDGFSITKGATGRYTVHFDDTSINNNFIINVTTHSSSPKFASAVTGNDLAEIYIWTSSGTLSNHAFQFVVYRR